MDSAGGQLHPLSYHQDVADRLEQDEPGGWATVLESRTPVEELPRSAVRLELSDRPVVSGALARAAENLGIDRPVAAYVVAGPFETTLIIGPDELAVVLS